MLSCPDECHAVDGGHDCLFDDFASNVSSEALGHLDELLVALILDVLEDQLEYGSVDVARSVRVGQIEFATAVLVSSKCCIVLHTVTGTVYVDVKIANVLFGVATLYRGGDFEHASKCLPRVF